MAFIVTDRTKLIKVLLNLVVNAIKLTKEGAVEFGYQTKSRKIEFSVKDNGIGIAIVDQPGIFSRFYQNDSSSTRRYEESGLRLVPAEAYPELLDGNIVYFSTR